MTGPHATLASKLATLRALGVTEYVGEEGRFVFGAKPVETQPATERPFDAATASADQQAEVPTDMLEAVLGNHLPPIDDEDTALVRSRS